MMGFSALTGCSIWSAPEPALYGVANAIGTPLPTSPARGEVPSCEFGKIAPNTPASTLPLAGRAGEVTEFANANSVAVTPAQVMRQTQ